MVGGRGGGEGGFGDGEVVGVGEVVMQMPYDMTFRHLDI